MTRIIIADAHRLFRETLAGLLDSNDCLEVIALCGDSDGAVETTRNEQPDLLLLDIQLKPSGIAITQKIRRFSDVKIICLSNYTLPSYAINIFSAGANGYMTRNSSVQEMFTGIDTVMNGKKYICREVLEIMVAAEMETGQRPPHAGMLTTREIEVAELISKGFSSREIALALDCSCKTVEMHRHHMLKKLQLKNTIELINYLYFQLPVAL